MRAGGAKRSLLPLYARACERCEKREKEDMGLGEGEGGGGPRVAGGCVGKVLFLEGDLRSKNFLFL